MLLEFSIENYKSFADKATFSMEAAPKQKGLDYSLHAIKVGRKTYKGLSSAVVYGPNAAGKTAIIGAMDTLKHIVMRGNVRDAETMTSLDRAAFDLSFIPNSGLAVPKPVSFGIRFFEGGDLFEYNLKIDLGGFMDPSYGRAIVRETLLVNERMVFDREPEAVELGDLDPAMFSGQVSDVFRENRAAAVKFLSVLDGEELFLTNGFKQIVSPKLSARVTAGSPSCIAPIASRRCRGRGSRTRPSISTRPSTRRPRNSASARTRWASWSPRERACRD